MSPERRAAYEARIASMKPGARAGRLKAKQEREAAALLQRAAADPKPVDPVEEELAAQLEAIRARRAVLEAELADRVSTEGVFDE